MGHHDTETGKDRPRLFFDFVTIASAVMGLQQGVQPVSSSVYKIVDLMYYKKCRSLSDEGRGINSLAIVASQPCRQSLKLIPEKQTVDANQSFLALEERITAHSYPTSDILLDQSLRSYGLGDTEARNTLSQYVEETISRPAHERRS